MQWMALNFQIVVRNRLASERLKWVSHFVSILIFSNMWGSLPAYSSCPNAIKVHTNKRLQELAQTVAENPIYLGAYVKSGIRLIVLDGRGGQIRALQDLQDLLIASGTISLSEDSRRVDSSSKPQGLKKSFCLGSICMILTAPMFGYFHSGGQMMANLVIGTIGVLATLGELIGEPESGGRVPSYEQVSLGRQFEKLMEFDPSDGGPSMDDGVYFLLANGNDDIAYLESEGFRAVEINLSKKGNEQVNQGGSSGGALAQGIRSQDYSRKLNTRKAITLKSLLLELGLDEMPNSFEELERAYNFAVLKYHPDLQMDLPQERREIEITKIRLSFLVLSRRIRDDGPEW